MELKDKLKSLPVCPGVYRFKNSDNEIIYVGKSKSLRSRVRSYFTGQKEGKVARLVHHITDLEYEVCDTHLEARLLECRLIKEIRPMYNAQFKRDRGFVYLKIGELCKRPILAITYDPASGIGPFRNRRLLEFVIECFEKLYPMDLEEPGEGERGRRGRKSGLAVQFEYSLLPRRTDFDDFPKNQQVLSRLFREKAFWRGFLEALNQAMIKAAEAERFQQAIFYRDFIQSLNQLHRMWFEDTQLFQELLFLQIPLEDGVKFFRIQNGRIEDIATGGEMDGPELEGFIRSSQNRSINTWEEFSEAARCDFKDILYSEIRALPKDQVVRRPSKGRPRSAAVKKIRRPAEHTG